MSVNVVPEWLLTRTENVNICGTFPIDNGSDNKISFILRGISKETPKHSQGTTDLSKVTVSVAALLKYTDCIPSHEHRIFSPPELHCSLLQTALYVQERTLCKWHTSVRDISKEWFCQFNDHIDQKYSAENIFKNTFLGYG
jgi:hypothetical protein